MLAGIIATYLAVSYGMAGNEVYAPRWAAGAFVGAVMSIVSFKKETKQREEEV
mgnify:CR=1 FL=1